MFDFSTFTIYATRQQLFQIITFLTFCFFACVTVLPCHLLRIWPKELQPLCFRNPGCKRTAVSNDVCVAFRFACVKGLPRHRLRSPLCEKCSTSQVLLRRVRKVSLCLRPSSLLLSFPREKLCFARGKVLQCRLCSQLHEECSTSSVQAARCRTTLAPEKFCFACSKVIPCRLLC